MKSRTTFLTLSVAALLALAGPWAATAAGDDDSCSLSITVVDTAGDAVPSATVSARRFDGATVKAQEQADTTYYIDGIGFKTTVELSHPAHGETVAEFFLPLDTPLVFVTIAFDDGAILRLAGDAGGGNPGPPCPGNGSCFVANGSPGCDDVDCCTLICGIDPFCCEVTWDGLCASQALDLCDGAPIDGACCFPDGSCDLREPDDCVNSGGQFQGVGVACADVFCPGPPPNDLCGNAIPLAIPSTTAGTTLAAGVDLDGETCGTSINAPGVWYTVVGTGTTITASTCNAFFDYDTKISVFCGSCDDLLCIGGNDDDCVNGASGLLSTVSWCSQAGATYSILVHGFGGQAGAFMLDVFENGQVCTPSVFCIPTGACCLPGDVCVELLTEADCLAQGGLYQGDGVACVGGLLGYVPEDCANGFEDISATGTEAPTASNVDDGGDVVPLGFSFSFFGDMHTQVGISSNGYLTFGTDLSDFSNDPIPSTIDPNDLIAPYWDDWSPNQGGTVHYQTTGAPGSRRFIAQWTNVPHFQGTGSSTFQAVLFEGSSAIEFRYGPLNLNSPTVGIENQDGTDGIAVAPPVEGECRRIFPQFEAPVVCADARLGWNWVDNGITLTANEPTYWSALTGLPKGVSPFTVLDPGTPPGRPAMDGTTDRVLRGYVIGWAVDQNGAEIKWNHLKGEGTIIDYRDTLAWEYNTFTHAVVAGVGHGELTGEPGVLRMDGLEYSLSFDELLLNFQAAGSNGFSGPMGSGFGVISNTDLTLHPPSADLRQNTDGPVTTKASMDIWNENETKFSGTHRCITCWDQTLISRYDVPNSFLYPFLQTDHGKARIDGHAADVCDVLDDPDTPEDESVTSILSPLLGVYARLLTLNGQLTAASASNLIGMGTDDTAVIEYDVTGGGGGPPEGQWPQDPVAFVSMLERLAKQKQAATPSRIANDVAGDPAEAVGPMQDRVSGTEKGSLIFFPKVELRWTQDGALVQDTFLSLTNDYPQDVRVQLYFINGDAPLPEGGP